MNRLLASLMKRIHGLALWWRNNTVESLIKFKCSYGGYYASAPVQLAKKTMPDWYREQIQNAKGGGSVKFVRCPGMVDYFQAGYIIVAHTDIHIKANGVGVIVETPLNPVPELKPVEMDYSLVKGMFPIADDVKKAVFKIPIPFGIYSEPGVSVHLLPALMHSPFLDKICVYPGIVDYEEFHTANLIISPIKTCEFVIPQGTPILHVLPFKRVDFHAISGCATRLEADQHRFGFMTRMKAAYRKKFHHKKHYTIEIEGENEH